MRLAKQQKLALDRYGPTRPVRPFPALEVPTEASWSLYLPTLIGGLKGWWTIVSGKGGARFTKLLTATTAGGGADAGSATQTDKPAATPNA